MIGHRSVLNAFGYGKIYEIKLKSDKKSHS